MEGENRLYTALSVAGGFFCLAASIFFSSAPAAAVSAFFFFLSILIWKYGYLIVPVLLSWANVVEIGWNFEIPPTQDLVVGHSRGSYLATAFLAARIYDSASEKDERQRLASGEMFEKAVSSAGFPFKVCAQVSRLDLAGELSEARTRRSVAESKKAQLAGVARHDPERLRYDREIAMWNRLAEKLGEGERPLEVAFYFSTTADGRTKEEAISRARSQSEELAVVLSSALACDVLRLKGEEMKKCFWWEFFGPANSEEFRDQMF